MNSQNSKKVYSLLLFLLIQYSGSVSAEPKIVNIEFQKAIVLEESGQLNKAADEYRRLLKLNSKNALAWNNLGLIQQKLGKLDKAEMCYQKALKLAPDEAQAYNNFASLKIQKAQFKDAESLYLQAIDKQADYPYSYNNLANYYQKQRQYFKAVEYYKKSIDKAPIAEFYYNLGLIYFDMKKYDDMVETFHEALEKDPYFINAYYSLALAHLYNLNEQSKEKSNKDFKFTFRKLSELAPARADEFSRKFLVGKTKFK